MDLACTWHQMQVFYNKKESPLPLDTDPIMEVDTIHRACKKNFLPSYYLLLALSLLMSCYFVAGIFADPIGLLSNSNRLVTEFAYLCLFVISSVELFTYFNWHRKAKQEAQSGIFIDTPSTSGFQKVICSRTLESCISLSAYKEQMIAHTQEFRLFTDVEMKTKILLVRSFIQTVDKILQQFAGAI